MTASPKGLAAKFTHVVASEPAPCLNSEGMRRNGFAPEQIAKVKEVYKIIYRSGLSLDEAKEQVLAMSDTAPELAVFKDFFALSSRGIIR